MELKVRIVRAGHVLLSRRCFEANGSVLVAVAPCDHRNGSQCQSVEPTFYRDTLGPMLFPGKCACDRFVDNFFPTDEMGLEHSRSFAIPKLAVDKTIQARQLGGDVLVDVAVS